MNNLIRVLVVVSTVLVMGSFSARSLASDDLADFGGPLELVTGSSTAVEASPLATLDMNFGRAVINQTLGTSPSSLTLDQYTTGFRVIQSRKIDAGVGLGAVWHFVSGGLLSSLSTAGFGVIPMVGSSIQADRFAPNQTAAQNLPRITLPTALGDFSTWADQDAMTFQCSGGVLFTGWMGYAGIGGAPMYLARGQWSVYIQKTSDTSVYVKFTKAQLRSLGLVAGTVLSPISVSRFKEADSSFSYIFDLSNPTGEAAYQDFIKGNVTAAQKLATANGVPGPVKLDMTIQTQLKGRTTHIRLGIPMLLDTRFTSGKVSAYKDVKSYEDGSEAQDYYGIHYSEKTNRVFFHQQGNRSTGFYGIVENAITNEGAKAQMQTAHYLWNFEKEHTSRSDLNKALAQAVKDTGLRQDLSVTVPAVNGDLGYASVSIDMLMPQSTTNFIVNMATFPNVLKALGQSAESLAKAYFAAGDADSICSHANPDFIADCQSDVEDDTAAAANAMEKQIVLMQSAENNGDWMGFAKAYAEFGKAMSKNQFTFQAVLIATQSAPAQITYTIEGQRLSIFKREILQPTTLVTSQN